MKLNKLMVALFAGSALLVSCNNDDDTNNGPQGAYDNGILVLNEGGFGAGNASVSFISDTLSLQNNIYAANNGGAVLGDTGQDIGLHGQYAYIVLNASNKIEVVNRYTFAHVASIITGLVNPRYIAFEGGKAYVTNWGDGGVATDDYVAVINLATNAVTTTIPVAEGPEAIIAENGKLYVAHKGGYGYGNKITVINGEQNTVTTTITVGDVPGSLEVEGNKLYVLNEGLPSYVNQVDPLLNETAGSLSVINLNTNTIMGTVAFDGMVHPQNLNIEGDKIYCTVDSEIFSFSPGADLPAAPHAIFSTTPQGVYGVYAMEVNEGHIYVGDAGNYTAAGKVYIYSLTGTLENTFTVGVIPSGFYFNE
ncbi:YncE family protein [Flavobacterium sp. RHBU_24]|uniref:YncE family protein n=1 Tax=Flavobacterium sp. RHBU_24 TaxID=3391185 RepID=UPI003984C890